MYRQVNRTQIEPGYRCRGAVIARPQMELVIEPREAPIPGQGFQTAFALPSAHDRLESSWIAVAASLLLLVAVSAHARSLTALAAHWWNEPGLACTFAVPAVAVWLLWRRRQERPISWQGTWWGLAIVLLGGCLDVVAVWGYYFSLGPWALLLTLAGICVLAGGRAAWHWCWPALVFLGFALPLPARLLAVGNPPFQRWAAAGSSYLLVTGGIPAISAGGELILGNRNSGDGILRDLGDGLLGQWRIGNANALSGLESLVICLAVCTAVAMIVQARTWERCFIVLSALPIALVGNVIRLTLVAALSEQAGPTNGGYLLGNAGGLLTILLALGLVCIELKVLRRAMLPVHSKDPLDLEQVGARN